MGAGHLNTRPVCSPGSGIAGGVDRRATPVTGSPQGSDPYLPQILPGPHAAGANGCSARSKSGFGHGIRTTYTPLRVSARISILIRIFIRTGLPRGYAQPTASTFSGRNETRGANLCLLRQPRSPGSSKQEHTLSRRGCMEKRKRWQALSPTLSYIPQGRR